MTAAMDGSTTAAGDVLVADPPEPGVPEWADGADGGRPLGPEDLAAREQRDASVRLVIDWLVVTACALFVFLNLHPDQILSSAVPAGGDMGAHVWGPAYLRDELLPAGRLSGWTPDWYAGFPAYQFYMLPPALLVLALDLVLPYGIALKLITVSGLVAMPLCAYAMGRLFRMPFPGPPLLAIATLPFLFDRTWTIYGGNVASTLAGEFSFSISLSLALLFFGVVARSLETGRHRGWAAVLLALVILSHPIPAFFALAGAAVLLLLRLDRQRIAFAVPTIAVGGFLTSFWSIPFIIERGFLTDMGWERLTGHADALLPVAT
ncbi:MAG: 6-pyruvoyl-tetrahydropterin synthase-related protein, partial [Acidimicrobiales bacterium]|nr:6-pyruvoyl-tetrahydropterin synthase-related protein [Acidimicrobiales bacterium]